MKGVCFSEIGIFDLGSFKFHSYDDFGLLLASADVPPARPKTAYIDLPGGHGSLDLSEANGGLCYKDRELRFVFYMKPNEGLTDEAYEAKKRELLQIIDGRETKIRLDTDTGWYYEGRCWLDEWASDRRLRSFLIVAKVKPFRFKCEDVVFAVNKESDVDVDVELQNEGIEVKPHILSFESDLRIQFDGGGYIVKTAEEDGRNSMEHKIVLKHGTNKLRITDGYGDIAIFYTERGL